MNTSESLPWNLYVELREEVASMQQLRARAIEFKITFVTGALGFLLARVATLHTDDQLLIIPAFAAVFFDFLINSYTSAVMRAGLYARDFIEPQLREQFAWRESFKLWEENLSLVPQRPILSLFGSVGITVLSAIPAARVALHSTWHFMALFGVLSALIAIVTANHVTLNMIRHRTWSRRSAESQHEK